MPKLPFDENVSDHIWQGLVRRGIADLVSVKHVRLAATRDEEILHWAAKHDYEVVTHDVSTMTSKAWQRVALGLRMPGVIAIPLRVATRLVLDDLQLACEAGNPDDFVNVVRYVPFRS